MENPIYDKVIKMLEDAQHVLRVSTKPFRTYPGGTKTDDNYCETTITIEFRTVSVTITKRSIHYIDGKSDAIQNVFFTVNHGLEEGPKALYSIIKYRLDMWLKELSERWTYNLHTGDLWYEDKEYGLDDILVIIESALKNKDKHYSNEIAYTFIDKALEERRFMRFHYLEKEEWNANNIELFIYTDNDIGINFINKDINIITNTYIPNDLIISEESIDAAINCTIKRLDTFGASDENGKWKLIGCDDERKEILSAHQYTLKEIIDGIREGLIQQLECEKDDEEYENTGEI